MVDISLLSQQLTEHGKNNQEGFPFTVEIIPGEVTVLKVTIEDREELPVFVSVTEDQILCISYLFSAQEVRTDGIHEMNNAMLSVNVAMPLSSFAKLEDQYVVFGAMSINAHFEELVHEIEVLSSNAIEAIEAMRDYLV